MQRLFALFLSILAVLADANAGSCLTNVSELTRILRQDDATNHTFLLTAVVTQGPEYKKGTFYVKDDSGCINMSDAAFYPSETIKTGDRYEFEGIIVNDDPPRNYAKVMKARFLSHGDPPQPFEAQTSDINSGKFIHCPVHVTGLVVDTFKDDTNPLYSFIVLLSEGEFLYLSQRLSDRCPDLSPHPGDLISVSGICYNHPSTRRHLGCCIDLHDKESVRIVRKASADEFAVAPLTDRINTLKATRPSGVMRRKTKGNVLAVWQGKHVLIRTEDGSVSKIELAEGNPPAYGDTIEAVGMPETDLYHLNLSRASWRPTGETSPFTAPPPVRETARHLLTDENGQRAIKVERHGQAITLQGIITTLPTEQDKNKCIELKCDGYSISVDFSSVQSALRLLQVGCTVDMTGTCVIDIDNWRPQMPFPEIRGFFLVARRPDDVRMLSAPSWWTPARLLMIIAILIATIAGLLVRSLVVRRMMRLQLNERTRLAVELHDTIVQNLTGATFEVNATEALFASDAATAFAHLQRASRTLQSCRDELRYCIWDLRNKTLDGKDLPSAIIKSLDPLLSGEILVVRFPKPIPALPDRIVHALLHIVRELVLNAVRHGHATTVRIAGAICRDRLRLSVIDNGDGFDVASCPGVRDGHFGLQGIRERVKAFSGTFDIRRRRPRGMKATLAISIHTKSHWSFK